MQKTIRSAVIFVLKANSSQCWRSCGALGANGGFNCYATKANSAPSKYTPDNRFDQDDDKKAKHNGQKDVQNPHESFDRQGTGRRISATEKRKFLINTLCDLKDSKESVYGTLDAWVAWEQNFPLVNLKLALVALQKDEQWHRIVQVLKWMLSKGQGTTLGTYELLIRALEKDNRAEEAHRIWEKKISHDLHSVPWNFCELMISIYYRNNMLDKLIKLFNDLESYERRPPNKSIVQKVADAYGILGQLDEKNRITEKYGDLFSKSPRKTKSRKGSGKKIKIADAEKSNVIVDLDPPSEEFVDTL